ncbi:PTS system, glucitol/sorbitol-specific IIA component [Halolactibacillus halophilus]|uniref:PTS sorbitol transporter subunit IIA n=1 Tax=Halolactibacillus halophilus TaxID=306540 RepID=A0A1I5R3Q3_9BACI|nr:PTS glucitol/sorbitol transporter subunit IIA [Halolactibacillus halophilus]GEM02711.1 PTS sorbitol transporter subunit IIA [Halolactibacillus halophilus]SFP52977.1 PTS system, glucitol/sorbitol-specific IIA component [Halolactibacillus halophilus]
MNTKLKVTNIGEMVEAFAEENLIILFGPQATSELMSISVMHEFLNEPGEHVIRKGTKIQINDEVFTVTDFGSAANSNFKTLGHISIYFKESIDELLPGAILVEPAGAPDIKEGDLIEFINE